MTGHHMAGHMTGHRSWQWKDATWQDIIMAGHRMDGYHTAGHMTGQDIICHNMI